MERWAVLSGAIGLSLCGILVWREWSHAGERGSWQAEAGRLEERWSKASTELAEKGEALALLETNFEKLRLEHASMRDRATNLEAQRNHLRSETERQSERARDAENSITQARKELEEARQRALELSGQPRELQARLDGAHSRIEELEMELDELTGSQSAVPPTLFLEGLATDGSVFALSGPVPESSNLPMSVYLCSNNSIRLEGWINRMEGGIAIGHVEAWHGSASTLVKGEKVFILPRQAHEADN